MADIAYPVPCEVIGHIINVPLEDFETFVEWSDALVVALSLPAGLDAAVDRAYDAIVAMKEYFREPVAEALRDPQDDFFSRLVHAEVDGVVVPAGSMLFGSVHTANRDPEVFVDPDRLDVTRENRRSHVGLGGGPHFCAGAALGRLETEVVLNAIIQQLRNVQVSADQLEWEASAMHRSTQEVPIRFTPT